MFLSKYSLLLWKNPLNQEREGLLSLASYEVGIDLSYTLEMESTGFAGGNTC